MSTLQSLAKARLQKVETIVEIFKPTALEGHLFGSLGRGSADELSDIDIWLTFKDENIAQVLERRFEYYSQIGDVVHVCEPPQNSPIHGVQSFVLYKTKVGLIPVDYYLCPQSTSFFTKASKKLFGDGELPIRELEGFNPQKIIVPETYRIDFFICFLFNAIKKIVRKNENALEQVFAQYGYLKERYGLDVAPLTNSENTFDALAEMIVKASAVANETQQETLAEIGLFMKNIQNGN